MKKLFFAMGLLLILAACGSDQVTITVFNWGEFIDLRVLNMFEEETGIRVRYENYTTNEDMYTALVRTGSTFDVLFPSDYMIERLIAEGRLARLNFDNIPNIRYIDPQFRYLAFDPENLYSVPYMWGTFGILYNTAMVDVPVYSWQILWDERFAGQIYMYDSSRDTFGAAQKMLGFSLNSTCPDELRQARDALIAQGSLVRAYLGDPMRDSMVAGSAALGTIFSGDALWAMSLNPDLNYVVPIEGTQLFFDSMVIPATSRNQEAAEAFINFMTRPDIALMNTLYIGYSTTNWAAFAELPIEQQNCPIYWPPAEALEKSEVFVDLGDFREQLERAWVEVLVSIR